MAVCPELKGGEGGKERGSRSVARRGIKLVVGIRDEEIVKAI